VAGNELPFAIDALHTVILVSCNAVAVRLLASEQLPSIQFEQASYVREHALVVAHCAVIVVHTLEQ